MKTVLVLAFSDHSRDARVLRQIRFLSERYKVIAAGYHPADVGNVEFIEMEEKRHGLFRKALNGILLILGCFERFYRGLEQVGELVSKASRTNADLIIANDIETLPSALKMSVGTPVLFDAHEYYPEQWENDVVFRLFYKRYFRYLCKKYMPMAASSITVSQGIAEEYARLTGVRPAVVTNAVEYCDLRPTDNRKSGKIRIVHHGGAMPSRKLENLIRMMELLDERFELYLMLVKSEPGYFDRLVRLASGNPRIKFIQPVPPDRVSAEINRYDIGIHLLPPLSFNARHALPNKLFDFIQARLAVAIWPSVEMTRIVKVHDLGIISEDFTVSSMAKALRVIDCERVFNYKNRAHKVALILNATNNGDKLIKTVESLLYKADPSM